MYIIALAWIYVVLMMSITETSVIAGIMTFTFYGVVPVSIILYLMGSRKRKQRRLEREQSGFAEAVDGAGQTRPDRQA